MATLAELRDRWFVKTTAPPPGAFPPVTRHPGSTLSDYTDGNRITLLVDGKTYMQEWYDRIDAMRGNASAELYHAGWRFEPVKPYGLTHAGTKNAFDLINDIDGTGVKVRIALSRHGAGVPSYLNRYASLWLLRHGVLSACLDNRFPVAGSNHHKAVCFKNPQAPTAILGSIDISETRWDEDTHLPKNPDRSAAATHDAGVLVEGPAVGDVERSFSQRWNDSTRTFGLEPVDLPQPLITSPPSRPAALGTHSVQPLHTYGRTYRAYGYSWSPVGEFTLWASYINALKQAHEYIYIEDQYFLPFDYPPRFRTGVANESDIVWQLGEALKRGVNVAVLVPLRGEDSLYRLQKYQRDLAVSYLNTVAASAPGTFIAASLHVGAGAPLATSVVVHSKLLICDDEFVLIGSANVCQRSMTHDGELSLGIVDGAEAFARDTRTRIWGEHLAVAPGTLGDPAAAFDEFVDSARHHRARLLEYAPTPAPVPPWPEGPYIAAMRGGIDPYAGPPRPGP